MPRTKRPGEDADVPSVGETVVDGQGALAGGDCQVGAADRKGDRLPRRALDAAVGAGELHEPADVTDTGPNVRVGADRAELLLHGQFVRLVPQLTVDVAPQLVPHGEVRDGDDGDDDRGCRDGRAGGEAGAQREVLPPLVDLAQLRPRCGGAHPSARNTYPTPRTVWIRRGSPSLSVFRRR